MTLLESAQAVIAASGDQAVDWDAVAEAAKAATDPGSLDLSESDTQGYAEDVRAARESIRSISGVDFAVPDTLEIQNRHHWIDANIGTFERAFEPLSEQPVVLPSVARPLNTASAAGSLAFISRHVLGQYDPLLLADGDEDHGLYFVHPNVVRAAEKLDVDYPRFRRWIAFHEVTHAAEFGAAPWLSEFLSMRLREAIDELTHRKMPKESFGTLNLAMTAVEGYAELLMDEAFDEEYDDLRRKLDARRSGGDPVTKLIRRLLGFQLKRQQYERGRAFFDAVVAERGIEGASVVWEDPAFLPSHEELESPHLWLDRVP
jgi:uncharacterized protein (DUF2342 family)